MPKPKSTNAHSQSPRRRSPRLILLHENNNNNPSTPKPKSTNNKSSIQSTTLTVPSLRRSARFSNQNALDDVIGIEVAGKRKTKRDGDEIVGRSKNESGGAKVKRKRGGDEIVEELKKEPVEGAKEKKKHGGDDEIVEESKKEPVEGGANGKRKHKQACSEIAEGWTKEQELALRKAYFTAKPTPHFWKNVSKMVPGKSIQDCFDRVHDDFHTPPQCQPRSRAKAINSSPLHKFSISASKLLKPTEKKTGKSNILKPKNLINQKSIENLLQRHLKVDQDRKGDIFSVLEPNIDFSISTNAIQPSQKLCTSKQQKENRGLLLSCTERSSSSSSSHKKSPSRFNVASGVQNLGSPPVLKQVKNKVQHEKYVNQLRVRDLRRRATSTRAKMSAVGDGNDIQKKDVKAAKVALVSEARDAINRFQQSQVNLMNTCSSDEDYDRDTGVECESE
ncbi:Homeodomain superfamily protein [Trifolium repens]|nr:Homeodomain superfamily protein [Trifolium repens]